MLDENKLRKWFSIIDQGFDYEKKKIITEILALHIEIYKKIESILKNTYKISDDPTITFCVNEFKKIADIYASEEFERANLRVRIKYDTINYLFVLYLIQEGEPEKFMLQISMAVALDSTKLDEYCSDMALAIYEKKNSTLH